MCLLLFVSCIAKAQDVTALWDFRNVNPSTLTTEANLERKTGYVTSTVADVKMYVDATNGKFKQRESDVQFNAGTILQVPVKSAKDMVTVVGYDVNYLVSGTEATEKTTEHKVTTAEAAKGYVEITSAGTYLYSIQVVHAGMVQEKELYTTNFSEWGDYETKAKEEETTVSWSTKYSHETLTFSIFNTQIGATNFNTGKFPNWEGGMLMSAKSDNPYIITSPLASITKVHFIHGATGGNRGWKLWAKGDGDEDWVLLSDAVANPAAGSDVNCTVNKTNCQLKFTNINVTNNAYLLQLDIYGNVDMSQTPTLGSFVFGGVAYQAADIFEEDADGSHVATIEIPNALEMPSLSNPITDLVFENGELYGDVTYETVDNGVMVTINVQANDDVATYKATFVYKPYFTLTYYNTDGSVLESTQKVEKDAAIETLRNDDGVIVADGKKFRGWFVAAEGGRKYDVSDVVTSDISLYAVATDIETESTTARYTYNLTDKYFYDEDHEGFNATGQGQFHDTTHGWAFKTGDKIELLVGGPAYIVLGMCRYGDKGDITITDPSGATVETVAFPSSADGQAKAVEYKGAAGTVTLTFGNGAYLHKITVINTAESPISKNEQGYYVVKAGDADNLLNTIDIVNANASSTDRSYIFIPDGTYDLGTAVLTPISGDNISLIGQSMENTLIVNICEQEGIGSSATFLVTGNNTYFQDLTLKNAYDYYKPGFAGRAVCLQDKGSRTICKNVRMLSYQDTYYSNNNSQFYFETSDIHGTVDFICGGGDVFFNNCTLTVEKRNADGSGECTITAPANDVNAGNKFGYVFYGCTIDARDRAEKFNYGRAWSNSPRCAYINTTLLEPEKLVSSRWTLGGMNVPADKFVEYNTMDAEGNVVSPETYVATFTKDGKSNTYETILTADEAAGYTIDKVFTNWAPATLAAQKSMNQLKAGSDNTLTWDAVDGAKAYAVFYKGEFVAITSATSYAVTEGEAADYTVRAANEMGGFGSAASTSTSGIQNVESASADVVRTVYYNVQGARVNASYKGLAIKVDTLKDGKTVAAKVIK